MIIERFDMQEALRNYCKTSNVSEVWNLFISLCKFLKLDLSIEVEYPKVLAF